jgi:hypothetical protein
MLRGICGAFALFYAILAAGLPTTFGWAWQTRNTAPACVLNNSGHYCQCSLDKGMAGTCCCKHGNMGEGAGQHEPASPNEHCSKLASCGAASAALAGAMLRIVQLAPTQVAVLFIDEEAGALLSASLPLPLSRHPDPLEKVPI